MPAGEGHVSERRMLPLVLGKGRGAAAITYVGGFASPVCHLNNCVKSPQGLQTNCGIRSRVNQNTRAWVVGRMGAGLSILALALAPQPQSP